MQHRPIDPPAPGDAIPAPPAGLYVHFPFCVSLCPYCDFVVVAGSAARGPRNRIAAVVEALLVEIDLRASALDERWGPPVEAMAPGPGAGRPPLETLYIGGGTPSLLPPEALGALVDRVRRRFGLALGAEVTLEANPGPDERGDPVAQREAGITRISFGAQSLHAGELATLGRRHGPDDVASAVGQARDAGIGSINLDLLYDVPGQTLDSWVATLEGALDLLPDHLSLYALTLDDPDAEGLTGPLGDHLPTRSGARRWRAAARTAQDDDRAAAMYHLAAHRLAEAGYRGYELSNWARPGHESRHNLLYWQRRPVEAVGPGAHAFDGVTRRWNAARLDGYVAALLPGSAEDESAQAGIEGATPPAAPSPASNSPDAPSPATTSPAAPAGPRLPPGGTAPPLEPSEVHAESLILGLRLDTGIALTDALEPGVAEVFSWASSAGLVEGTADGRVRLTTRGRLLSNELFVRLI